MAKKNKSGLARNVQADQQIEKIQYALALQNLGQFEMAAFIYKEVIASDKNCVDALYLLGVLYMQSQQFPSAIESLQRAIKLVPNNPFTHFNLGTALCGLKQFSKALASFDSAIALKADYAEAYCNKANALMDMGMLEKAIEHYVIANKYAPNLAEPFCHKGMALNTLKKHAEALEALNNAIRLSPNYADAYYHRGNTFIEIQQVDLAAKSYQQAIIIRPDYESAKYALAALTQENPPARAPSDYVANLFDGYAENFDQHLTQVLEYKTPYELAQQLRMYSAKNDFDALDLGCGTGLCAVAFDGLFKTMDGVDLSSKMVNKAQERGMYRNLVTADIDTYLSKQGISYDLIICADVLVYIGDLSNVFEGVKRVIKDKGFFSFSVELSSEQRDFVLNTSMRYGHSKQYVQRLVEQNGFKTINAQECQLRKDGEKWITGLVFLVQTI